MAFSVFPIQIGEGLNIFIDIFVSVVIIGLMIYGCIRYNLSKKVIIITAIITTLLLATSILDLPLIRSVTLCVVALLTIYVALLLTSPEKELELRHHKKVSKKETALTINETDELIANLQKAVNFLSATQTGALITIERTDDLSVLLKNSGTGTAVNAPVTPELLETIFYKGTPLHDGATIIRGNMIFSSAVFYQTTQKPLTGKYGSRHRAALGISEISDALTIVVSEETGKVSFSYKGELIGIPVAQFSEKIRDYLLENK